MKRLFASILVSFVFCLMIAAPSMAGEVFRKDIYSSYSGTIATQYSAATNTGKFTKKAVVVNGMYNATTYGNFSGTFLLQCGPTASGPWTTCKDIANTAVSTATNAHFNINSNTPFIRASWAKTKHRISVWLFYSE